MLLWLTDYLSQFVGGFAVFQYLTLRTMVSVMTALITSLLIGPYVIERLSYLQLGQTVRDDGPETHLSKAGTPTMGGALILIVIILTTLLWGDLSSRHIWVVLDKTDPLTTSPIPTGSPGRLHPQKIDKIENAKNHHKC